MLRFSIVSSLSLVLGLICASDAVAKQATVSVMQGAVPATPAVVAPVAISVAPCAGCAPVVEPTCSAPVTVCKPCCPTPCITYRTKGDRRSCLADKPKISLTVAVKNPQTCCVVMVPICVPCCCVEPPCVDSRCGAFHRGIVTHDYKCGLHIDFVFDKHGDLLVTYRY
ncbi:MAG: hypothetical protein QM811_01560 [Pirellulales bacterium]